ncbi:MAG: hypothetical protein HFJ38_04410 [Bacilli bacterium]|nr:hypothetical protein [Bacilli bacterium]
MYRFDVRLITSNKGIDILKQQAEESQDQFLNVMKNTSINKTTDDIVYLGWNRLNNNCVNFLRDTLDILEENDITHTMAIIGENFDDIDTYYYVATEDENKNIPMLDVDRVFNENEVETFFNNYEKQIDTIEY